MGFSRKVLREVLTELRGANCSFSVCQNRHIKIDVTNHVNAQTAVLILATSPSDVNAGKASLKQCKKNLERVGISVTKWK
jgi:hypothetical protein